MTIPSFFSPVRRLASCFCLGSLVTEELQPQPPVSLFVPEVKEVTPPPQRVQALALQAPIFDARVQADASAPPIFLPGIEACQTPGLVNHILGFLEAQDAACAVCVSRGFHRALQYSTTVRVDPRQGDIQKVLKKHLTLDDKGRYTENRCITELDLSDCRQLADNDLAFVAEYFPALKVLKLRDCSFIMDTGLASVSKLKNLEHLDLGYCQRITDAGLAHVSKLKKLQHLDLMGCELITDAGLEPVSKLTKLQYLDLLWCDLITDTGLGHVSGLENLQYLDLWGCELITDAGLEPLSALKNLQYLDLLWCEHVTDAGLANFGPKTKIYR